jgi:hypothetical protein
MVRQRYASTKDPFLSSPEVYYKSTDEWIHSASSVVFAKELGRESGRTQHQD